MIEALWSIYWKSAMHLFLLMYVFELNKIMIG